MKTVSVDVCSIFYDSNPYLYGIFGLYPCDDGGADCNGGAWGARLLGVKFVFFLSMISFILLSFTFRIWYSRLFSYYELTRHYLLINKKTISLIWHHYVLDLFRWIFIPRTFLRMRQRLTPKHHLPKIHQQFYRCLVLLQYLISAKEFQVDHSVI